jgi:aspartate carbamoyltransferase catalytic subunit
MNHLSFSNLLSSNQVKISDIELIFQKADKYISEFRQGRKKWQDCCGKIMMSLFFESSTRTRFSFESAMIRLGGEVITLEQGLSSSIKKGESLADMGRVVSSYGDIIVMRYPEKNSVVEFSKNTNIPVINAGDGTNEHPTQALTDIYTIYQQRGNLENLNIGIVGDLKYSRTIYSLIKLLSLFKGSKFTLISDKFFKFDRVEELQKQNIKITQTANLEDNITNFDVLYVTRMQQERFSKDETISMKKYRIDAKLMQNTKKDLMLMHPLPRVDEISPEVDNMPQAKYFKQVENAVFIRMALISYFLPQRNYPRILPHTP